MAEKEPGEDGRARRSRGGFRRRLLVAFLLLGTLPALLLTLLYLRYLTSSIELWQNPGVEALLENSLALARSSLGPLEEQAQGMASILASDGEIAGALARGNEAAARAFVREFLARAGDAVGGNEPFALLVRAGEAPASGLLAEGPAPGPRALRRLPPAGSPAFDVDEGVVWCRLPMGAADGSWMVVAGLRLEPARAAQARSLAEGLPLYRSLGAYKRVRLRLLWAVAGGLLVVLVLASWSVARLLSGSLSRPLLRLVEGTRRVASGDYDYRVAEETPDELGALVAAFNRMSGDLKTKAEELRRAERVAAWQEVARRLAHQIKNPLTPIQLSVHRLRSLSPAAGSKEHALLEDCLDTVTAEVANLRRIAEEFARFARLPEPRLERVELGPLVRSVVELYLAGQPQIRARLDVAADLPPARLDPDLTRQALTNLVKNAVEAMPQGGELAVTVGRGPARTLRVTIEDTGGGIPSEVMEHLFTPYLTTKPGGTGLGLALAHRMVVDQGGSLAVLTRQGSGTTVHLDFAPDDAPGRTRARAEE